MGAGNSQAIRGVAGGKNQTQRTCLHMLCCTVVVDRSTFL